MSLLEGRAFAGVMLVVVATFAAGAVALLTITLVQADQITEQADTIAERISDANRELEAVRLADRTSQIAGRIAEEAEPLDDLLVRVVDNTESIDRTVGSILGTTVAINDRVEVLQTLVRSVNADVRDIDRDASAILANVFAINNDFRRILSVARSIDRGVAGINTRAERVIAITRRIERDLTGVVDQVGRGHGGLAGQDVLGHAHSIDCSVLLVREPYC